MSDMHDGELARRREALHAARRWAPAFGCDLSDCDLAGYELIVVDGLGESGREQRHAARLLPNFQTHAIVLSYLSIGTVEDWRSYASMVPADWTLGKVDDWEGERYADLREPGWQELMVEQAAILAALGFDGLYLDNLDVAEDHPPLADALVTLVERLRATVPDLLLVGQNGLATAERLPLDAVAHEDVFWRYDDGYRPSPAAETRELLAGLRRLRARGLPIFTLDYAPPGSDGAAEAMSASLAEGFHPAVSVLELDRPPHLAEPAGRAA